MRNSFSIVLTGTMLLGTAAFIGCDKKDATTTPAVTPSSTVQSTTKEAASTVDSAKTELKEAGTKAEDSAKEAGANLKDEGEKAKDATGNLLGGAKSDTPAK